MKSNFILPNYQQNEQLSNKCFMETRLVMLKSISVEKIRVFRTKLDCPEKVWIQSQLKQLKRKYYITLGWIKMRVFNFMSERKVKFRYNMIF